MKNKIVLIMPGVIGHYLKEKLPNCIANARWFQNFFAGDFRFGISIPLSLLAIAPYLIQDGFEVKIIDGRVEDASKKIYQEVDENTLYVGITALTGSMIKYALYDAAVIRKINSNIPIVWGGVHVTLSPEQSLATSDLVDIVVRGEGEETSVELAKALQSHGDLSTIRGISWKKGREIIHNVDRPFMDFNKQLPLNYDLINLDWYDTKSALLYQSERGCPHRCSFCDVVIVHRKKFRAKTAEQVIRDFRDLYDKFKPDKIHLVDDCFFSDIKRANAIIDALIEDKTRDIKWHASCRAQYSRKLDVEFWEKAKRSGLIEVYVGAESGSQKILDYIKKDCTVDDVKLAAKQITSAGMLFWTNFMTGFPGETKEDVGKTIELIDFLNVTYEDGVRIGRIFLYAPCPGTPLYYEVIKEGYQPPNTLQAWGNFRIGDVSHTLWHPDIYYMASVAISSQAELVVTSKDLMIWSRVKRGVRKYRFSKFVSLLLIRLPELIRTMLLKRVYNKWVQRKFKYTWDLKLLRQLNLIFYDW